MMKQMTLSIEQMKHLEELGLDTSDASMCWITDADEPYLMVLDGYDIDSIIPAYTLQDILEKINLIDFVYNDHEAFIEVDLYKYTDGYRCCLMFDKIPKHEINGNSILEASYQMLLWCIENGYIK